MNYIEKKDLYFNLKQLCEDYKSHFDSADFNIVDNLRLEGYIQCVIGLLDNVSINSFYEKNCIDEDNLLWFCRWYLRRFHKEDFL